MTEEKIEQQFAVSGPSRLRVSNIRGSVDVQAGEDGIIKVMAVKHLDSGDPQRTEIEISQSEDGSVRVKTHFYKGWWSFFDWRQPCRVDYTIRVPRSCSVKVRCVSSDASVQGLEGEFDLKAVSGALQLRELTGQTEVGTVSGSIQGERLSGPADIDTVSGRVRLASSNLPTVDVSSVSGSIVLETPLGAGPYRLKTVSGDAELIVPAGSRCTIETRSVSGHLKTTLPISRSWQQDRRRGTEIQGGGSEIFFNSVSGDLRVTPSGGEPAPAEPVPAAPAPAEAIPAPPAAPPEPVPAPAAAPARADQSLTAARRAILERIARGELTAEQGVAELKKLRP